MISLFFMIITLFTFFFQEDKKGKKKKEESYEVLENMARVLPAQLQYVTFKENSRYTPVKSVCHYAIKLI